LEVERQSDEIVEDEYGDGGISDHMLVELDLDV